MQTHIGDKTRKYGFLLFFADSSCFLLFFQVSTHFLSVVSKILRETIISDIRLRFCRDGNDANPYFQQFKTKKHGFWLSFFADFAVFWCFLQDSPYFLPFISKILVEIFISDIKWRYWGENNDASPFSQQFKTKKTWYLAVLFSCFLQDSTHF